jgi:ferredoxin
MSMYRIVIDRGLCSSFGSCLDHAPAAFALDTGGTAVARLAQTDDPEVLEAARSCPMGAIAVVDAVTGEQAA